MKARVIKDYEGQYTIEVKQGHQSFRIDFHGNKAECRWMARMFRIALKHHNDEVIRPR